MRRLKCVSTSLVIAIAVVVGVGPDARGATATCSVENARTHATSSTLQEAVDAAVDADTLRVRGECVGVTRIVHRDLVLRGDPTIERPVPLLDGGGVGRVLVLFDGEIVLRNLIVTHGSAPSGGGIYVRPPSSRTVSTWLVLAGSTVITANEARYGGGIYVRRWNRLTLRDQASVVGNTARLGGGGGILSDASRITLNDSASITGNIAERGGGGALLGGGRLTLNDSATVSVNMATHGAGGGVWAQALVTLNDSASVVDNTAAGSGGGIKTFAHIVHTAVYICSDLVRVSPNDPDDPPKTQPCS